MSFTLHGVGVSTGIAIGRAHPMSHTRIEVAHYMLHQRHIQEEIERFDDAIITVRAEMAELKDQIPDHAPHELPAFLDLHLMILNDATLSEAPKQLISEQQCNAEWALTQQMEQLIAQFDAIEDDYLRERKHDVVQVVDKVLKVLLGHPASFLPQEEEVDQECILVAHDLTPTDMVIFKRATFAAFVTDLGGATSHTAILARSLNIPAVMALHSARTLIRDHETIIVDGREGVVIVDPDETVLEEYRLRQDQQKLEKQKLKKLTPSRAATLDGTSVELLANIELPQDVEQAREAGAAGIGLFRSEFLFMNRSDLPSEDEQFEAYRAVVEAMKGKPVTIRTLDIGADKRVTGLEAHSDNPALGLRAIRLCLAEPRLFRTQIRALLRAAYYGKVHILIPMLSQLAEIEQSLQFIEAVKRELTEEGTPFNKQTPIGGMIEVPAAALSVRSFGRKLDFLSIGTNDLIQYTLAIDRTDDHVAHLYDPLQPAVLALIQHTIRTANRMQKPVALCGEMAGDAILTRLLLGMGLRSFSMHPASLLAVKQAVLQSDLTKVNPLAKRILRAEQPSKVRELLERLNG
jgi:phosphoenolpyruvate-protein phosphotransferase (PTS system enzyme I)